ncbi:MAG: alanine--tRNA ligase [Sphingomonadales bacterium]
MPTSNEIRDLFLNFFAKNGHEIVPSSPLVPRNDPTLMFTNAGMVQFKDVFTGLETRPYERATSSQKCVRAGGKHNDLDNVGYTARHHTFFEMLGNFSFGDYFKERAIELAWELVHKEMGLPKDRLITTVYHTDDEAYDLWRKISGLSEDRIIRIPTKDNFWAMGETGPCGPCTEIFYDHGDHIPGGPPGSPDEDGDRFVEIWNLVFMQYDQRTSDERVDLPKPSVDTGMGLERMAAVLQGTHDNYDTDLMRALIMASAHATNTDPDGNHKISHRVVADHLRAMSFLIADGVLPSNEGRGYVLRRIMRRAMRHAHLIGAKDPLMHRLVPSLVAEMGSHFPELGRAQTLIGETLLQEETRFRQTLERGLKLLDEELEKLPENRPLPGKVAFKLYDTYGFPYDLTEDALRSQGLSVDREGFDKAMEKQRADARAAWAGSGEQATDRLWYDFKDKYGATEFLGYSSDVAQGVVLGLVIDGQTVEQANAGQKVQILTNQTPFYGESGGQAGDRGVIYNDNAEVQVRDTQKPLGLHVHMAEVKSGSLKVGDNVTLRIDSERRRNLRANHSATHLLHEALRRVLGEHVAQKGSYVGDDRLRFDFAHPKAVTDEEITQVETAVNEMIRQNEEVVTRLMTPDEAIDAGAIALFGEKYGDEVRVLFMGHDDQAKSNSFSIEFCGGTHVKRLGDIGLFKIVNESAVSSGVRRIEAVVGEAARQYFLTQEENLKRAADALKASPQDVADRVVNLVEERKRLEKELSAAKKQLAMGGGSSAGPDHENVNGLAFLGQILDGVSAKDLRGLIDAAKKRIGSGVAVMIAVNDGKAAIAVGVSDDLKDRISAVDLVKVAAAAVGGKGGGGRPDMAQAGGPDGDKAQAALDDVKARLLELSEN